MPRLLSDTHDTTALDAQLQRQCKHPLPAHLPMAPVEQPDDDAPPTRAGLVFGLVRRLPGVSGLSALLRLPRRLRSRLQLMQAGIDQLGDENQHLRMRQDELSTQLEQLRVAHEQLVQSSQRLALRVEQLAQLPADAGEGRRGGGSQILTHQEQVDLERWYQGFQTSERGSFEAIQKHLADYLPLLREVLGARVEGRVLDLGCGRGEWLDLLRKKGIEAFGVDDSDIAVAGARQRGLAVKRGDLLETLLAQPASSLDVVTAFQVVEHLPFAALYQLMAQARRVLRPRGLLLLETPNPESLPVSSYSFWLDPTHRHPIPPPLLYDLAVYMGFVDLKVVRSNPWPSPQLGKLDDMQVLLHQRLYAGQDYTLIARAPGVDKEAEGSTDDEHD